MELKTLHNTDTYSLLENAEVLEKELAWLNEVIQVRIALYFKQETLYTSISEILPPVINAQQAPYGNFVKNYQLNVEERLVLILALAPHVQPTLLDILLTKNKDYDRRFTEFGGLFLEGHSGLIPTAETAMFLLAGAELKKRLEYQRLFTSNSLLVKKGIIKIESIKNSKPLLSSFWLVTQQYVDYLLYGKEYKATYGPDFPAQQISTALEWDDLVVSRSTTRSLQEIRDWIMHGENVLQQLGLEKRLKPGYKSLFYGLSGTGKTMTAALLGKSTGKQVYKIDLSMTVSKYIGETEKNLAKVFDQAEDHNWILFFDEADSLFGKRTQVNSANDRYGNQEIGYLLQRIEDFPGIVILATNLKDNIDDAFTRRFQSMIEFKMPAAQERFVLWQQSFSSKLPLQADVNLKHIAEKYQISGGLMMNVVRKCTLQAVSKQQNSITQQSLETAIRQELQKEGILLN